MKQNLKKNEAITLISLVVTIIVLIILAGISINLILGQDGIINKAKEAKQNMEYAQIEEQEQLNGVYEYLEVETIGTSDDKIQEIASKYQTLKNEYDALQENYNNLNTEYRNFKTVIANAITEMGVETSQDANTDTMVNNIKNISTGTTNLNTATEHFSAVCAEPRTGYKFTFTTQHKVVGIVNYVPQNYYTSITNLSFKDNTITMSVVCTATSNYSFTPTVTYLYE